MAHHTIAVAGTGYVGLSIATLLAQHNRVIAVDIVPEKVNLINQRISPIQDEYIENYLAEKELDLVATTDAKDAYSKADFVVIATPTNYDSKTQHFDTSAVENMIETVLEVNPEALMVIKSTIPVGYTKFVKEKYGIDNIMFSSEFLRESKALDDSLYLLNGAKNCCDYDDHNYNKDNEKEVVVIISFSENGRNIRFLRKRSEVKEEGNQDFNGMKVMKSYSYMDGLYGFTNSNELYSVDDRVLQPFP